MKHLFITLLFTLSTGILSAGKIDYVLDSKTGSIQQLSIQGDDRKMNWVLTTDGSQYEWVTSNYGWGLGEFVIATNTEREKMAWVHAKSQTVQDDRSEVIYDLGKVLVTVSRYINREDLVEEVRFTNTTNQMLRIEEIAINTPFNDNYPDAETCYYGRTNAHIWTANHTAYVNAMHMSGNGPHLGWVLEEGNIKSYEIRERSPEKGLSNFRGVILMNPENMEIKPKGCVSLRWRIFSHQGKKEFRNKIKSYGTLSGYSKKYVYETDETAVVYFESENPVQHVIATVNGKETFTGREGNKFIVEYPVKETGKLTFKLHYDNGKSTYVDCLAISGTEELIHKRVNFIIDHQQLNDPSDPRDGAYMVYDNELKKIFLNDGPAGGLSDCDEGRERLGMGVLLALQYQKTGDRKIYHSLEKYVKFVNRLQAEDHTTFSTPDHQSRIRPYNYPWVANFYFEMFHVTGDKQFLIDGYQTLKAMYRRFGNGFYAIDFPVKGYQLLEANGYTTEAASLLEDFINTADTYLENGWNYPKSEVNYEQSIVAPSIIHLLRIYLITKDTKYLKGAEKQLPLLESFSGNQPSFHMNEIAIRHWDGYWFGKKRVWGDNYPHYWSTLTALAYSLYYECTGNEQYQKSAENIVRNNLCQFFEDGKASCLFVYPDRVDGEKGAFFDAYANDQDWALVYHFIVNSKDQPFPISKF